MLGPCRAMPCVLVSVRMWHVLLRHTCSASGCACHVLLRRAWSCQLDRTCSAMLCTLLQGRVCLALICRACSCQPVRAMSGRALRASDNSFIPCLAMSFPDVADSFMPCVAMPHTLAPTRSRHGSLCRACGCQLVHAMFCCAAHARPSPSPPRLPIPFMSMRCGRALS